MVKVAVLCAAISCLLAAPARGDDARTEARAHSDLGRVAFNRGDYRTALEEYRRAYEAAPVPALLFNIGRCQEQLGDRAAAVASYRKYLAAVPAAEDRAAVEASIAELERALASPGAGKGASAPAAPPTAPMEKAPATSAPPLERSGGRRIERSVAPGALDVSPPPETAAPRTPSDRPLWRRWWLWTAVAVGVVGAGVAIGVPLGMEGSSATYSSPFPSVDLTPVR
jgi:tetratricopeptide (TPR) repeat protein